MTYTVHQAKTQLSRLLAEVSEGKEVIIARGDQPIVRMAQDRLSVPKHCEFQAAVIIEGKTVKRVVVADDSTVGTRIAIIKRTGKPVRLERPDFRAFKTWYRNAPFGAYEKRDGPIFPRKKKRRKKRKLKPTFCSGGLPSLGQRR